MPTDDGPTTPGEEDGSRLGRVLPLPPAPDGMELRHLRAFVAVAEELNPPPDPALPPCVASA